MPCLSDPSMNANEREIEMSRVECVLDELRTGVVQPRSFWEGYHPRAYNHVLTKRAADARTAEACEKLRTIEAVRGRVTHLSLETQMWWRDHQAADARRNEDARQRAATAAARKAALAKLTPYERDVLGLKEDGE